MYYISNVENKNENKNYFHDNFLSSYLFPFKKSP